MSTGPAPGVGGRGALAAAWLLGVLWAAVPLIPALLRGELPGGRYTDLYPSVWGLGWFMAHQPGLPTWIDRLAAPDGMPFYFSAPLHGWPGWPFAVLIGDPLRGAVVAYVATLILARGATVLVSFYALRALGYAGGGALAGALVYGASPYFHGFSAEGIIEGTDGWALALWVWMVARERRLAAVGAFALCVVSSWYLGMVACALALAWGWWRRVAWASLVGGLVLASPFVWAFLHAAPGAAPLPDDVRIAMGAPLAIRAPWWRADTGFALNTWIGLSIPVLALLSVRRHPGPGALALVCFLLSTGWGPWYDLPVFASVRFPYRWHAGTLACLAPLVAATVERSGRSWLALLPFVEAALLSPIPLVLPGAPTDVPAIYTQVRGPILLDVPGPVALPPGEINLSRPRARYLLYAQLQHGAASPWVSDFNGIAASPSASWLEAVAAYDRVWRGAHPDAPVHPPIDLVAARAAGVTQVMVHLDELGAEGGAFVAALKAAGAHPEAEEGRLALFRLEDSDGPR